MRFDAHYPIVSGYDAVAGVRLLPARRRSAAVPPVQRDACSLALHARARRRAAPRSTSNIKRPTGSSPTGTTSPTSTTSPDPFCAAAKATRSSPATHKPLIYDPPRQLDVFGSASAYFGLDQLPGAQNIPSPKDLRSAEIGLRYTNTTKALGGVDHEKGFMARDRRRRRPGGGPRLSQASTAASTIGTAAAVA